MLNQPGEIGVDTAGSNSLTNSTAELPKVELWSGLNTDDWYAPPAFLYHESKMASFAQEKRR